jgi:hypothetical protein
MRILLFVGVIGRHDYGLGEAGDHPPAGGR